MNIGVVGVNHNLAPINVREAVSFTDTKKIEAINILLDREIDEIVILSTCNRSEIYISGENIKQKVDEVANFYKDYFGVKDIEQYLFKKTNLEAIQHLFDVTAGLDSLVVGEDQILGQVRNAYFLAMESGYTKTTFHCLFQSAITAAKRMKTDTILSKSSISTAGLALKTAMECQQDLPVKNVMIIGASGKIGSIVLKDALDFQGLNIFITARHELSHPLHGQDMRYTVIPYEKRYEYMPDMDIVISATASPHYTVMKEHFLAQNPPVKKRVFFDLAVPADIEPEMLQVPETVCYSMEDMQELARQNNAAKLEALPKAKAILSKYEEQFVKNMAFGEALPAIAALSERAQEALGQESAYSLVHKFVCQAKKNCDADEFVQFTKILNKIVEVEV